MTAQRAIQLVEAGLFLRLSGDLEGAKRLFEQALKLDPNNARARHLLEGGVSVPVPPAREAAPVAPSIAPSIAPPQAQSSPPPISPVTHSYAPPQARPPPARQPDPMYAPPSPDPFAPPAQPSSGFEADWGLAIGMEAPATSAPAPWGAPRAPTPALPMGAPQTTTMAFPMSQADGGYELPPLGAPNTSTMAYPMAPLESPAPRTGPSGWTPVPLKSGYEPAPGTPDPGAQGWGAPQTSTVAYSMGPQPSAEQQPPQTYDAWSQPPTPHDPSAWEAPPNDAHPGSGEHAGWGAPPTSTMAYSMSAQTGAPPTAVEPAPHDNWGAPPTSTLAYPMTAQPQQHQTQPAEHDPWAEFRVEGGQKAPDGDANMWNAVALAPRVAAPVSYAPPAVNDPYSPPRPDADDDWTTVTPNNAAPTAPQGVPTNLPPAPAPGTVAALNTAPAPRPVASNLSEAVPWEHTGPVEPPPRPRPPPVAFADWAQPSNPTPVPGQGPWRSGETPARPIPAEAIGSPPATLQSLAPMLPGPSPQASTPASPGVAAPMPEESEDIDVFSEDEEEAMAAPPAPAPAAAPAAAAPPPAPVRRHAIATGIPDPPGWNEDGFDRDAFGSPSQFDHEADSLDSDFSEATLAAKLEATRHAVPAPRPPAPAMVQPPPPPAEVATPPPAVYARPPPPPADLEPPAPVAMAPVSAPLPPPPPEWAPPPPPPQAAAAPAVPPPVAVIPPPAPSGPPPPKPGYEASLLRDAQNAWETTSNPGFKMPTGVLPMRGDAFDLIHRDDQARRVKPEPEQKDMLAQILRKAKDLLDLDDHTGAMALMTQADALAPNDPEVKRLKDKSESTLQRMYESKIGDLQRVPRVKLKEDEIIWLNLDHRAGFMLAQVDGSSTYEDLFALSGMSRIDTARILAQLIDEGVIVVS